MANLGRSRRKNILASTANQNLGCHFSRTLPTGTQTSDPRKSREGDVSGVKELINSSTMHAAQFDRLGAAGAQSGFQERTIRSGFASLPSRQSEVLHGDAAGLPWD